jgi:hypothetical protein
VDTTKIHEEAARPFTAEEILNHPEFADFVQAEINAYDKSTLPTQLKTGKRFKRTPYDALKEQGILTPFAIISEFDKICNKTCMLTSLQRTAIDYLIISAFEKLMKAVEKREKDEKIMLEAKALAAETCALKKTTKITKTAKPKL